MSAKKIMIVDDAPSHLENLRSAVKGTGAKIVEATNGKDAVTKAQSEHPDIIFMDVVMDGLDGFGACREITRNESTKNIPVIFVTTKDQRADRIWAEKQGAKAMLTKPFSQVDIEEQVRRYC